MSKDVQALQKENFTILNNELDGLEHGHTTLWQISYVDFWRHVKIVNQMFRDIKPISSEDWHTLTTRKNQIISSVKNRQEEENIAKKDNSRLKCQNVLAFLKEAQGWARGGGSRSEMEESQNYLNKAKDIIFEKDMIKDDANTCWEEYKRTQNILYHRRIEVMDSQYTELMSRVNSLAHRVNESNHKEISSSLKDLQAEMKTAYLNKNQRQELRESIQRLYEEINRIRSQKQAEWEQSKRERERKQAEWEERQREKERKHAEWEQRQRDNQKRHEEFLARQRERERRQAEWEERQRDRERKQAEWEQRKAENQRKYEERKAKKNSFW